MAMKDNRLKEQVQKDIREALMDRTIASDCELPASVGNTFITGDVNDDGSFNVSDLVLMQKWLLAVPDTKLKNWKAGDLCKDDTLDVFDLCAMRSLLLTE